jgi:hypothetical protein
MPDINEFTDQAEWMKVCVPKMMDEGKDNDTAVGACMGMWNDKTDAQKYRVISGAIKAVGDWELDITALPFKTDSDGQWFDENTDIMADTFTTPLVVYQHGIAKGARQIQGKLEVIGKAVAGSLRKEMDGWHIRVVLDKLSVYAKAIMDAAKAGAVAVSSGSISHLARLDVGNKIIPYEKNRPGRIAVWPFAEISLWDKGNGNMEPANRFAVALPAMKAIYRDAGLPFPDVEDTHGALPCAQKAAKRTEIKKLQKRSKEILIKLKRK